MEFLVTDIIFLFILLTQNTFFNINFVDISFKITISRGNNCLTVWEGNLLTDIKKCDFVCVINSYRFVVSVSTHIVIPPC